MNNPNTGKNSISLSIAVTGFIFTMIFITACLVASWVTKKPEYLSYVAGIATSILTPTLGSYVARAFTDAKFSNNTPAEVKTDKVKTEQDGD